MPTLVDHAFLALFVVVVPLIGLMRMSKLKKLIEADQPGLRVAIYTQTMVTQWALLAGLVAIWIVQDRSAAVLGVTTPRGVVFWVAIVVILAGAAYLLREAAQTRRDKKKAQKVLEQIESVDELLPHTKRELHWFYGLSVTAGICEEILYRGFMFWWVTALGGGVWMAVAASAIGFGLGHVYQGVAGAAKIAALGAVFAALYWITESIWAPILAHILLDIVSGATAHAALCNQQPELDAAPAA